MKTLKRSFIVLAVIVSIMPVTETKAQSVAASVNFHTFHQELSPYGRWINNPRFGQVWVYNEAGFKPYYTNGHWEYTNYGWSWESDYNWGWAPFHYGRWEQDPYHGWMWIPGYEWASAWVSWSRYDDYYGWAPLGYGSNINGSFGAVPYDRWNFIPRRYISDRYVNRYCVPHHGNNNFRSAVVINNYYNGNNGVGRYGRGPQRREAERYTGNRITERRIDFSDRNRNRGQQAGNSNFSNGRRNYDGANQNPNSGDWNNRRRNDNATTSSDDQNRREQNSINRPGRIQTDDVNTNNGESGNNLRRRDMNQNRENTTPPVIENRWPSGDINRVPQTNESYPGKRPNENRMNRRNDLDNRVQPQQQQQRFERPSPTQRPQIERPAPQQQQRYERSVPSLPSAPAMEQRRLERSIDNTGVGNMQRSNDNNQRGNRNREIRRYE